jgi:hypothetical protein
MKEKNISKHKRKIFLLFTILFALAMSNYSCSETKKTINETEMNQITTELTTNFDVSAKTRQLIKDIQDELTEQKTSIQKYTPSKSIIEKYDILKIEDVYHISGMMMIKENFIKSTLDDISVKTGSQSGKFTTVQIPANKFDLFLQNEGIEYFQVTEKVKTK